MSQSGIRQDFSPPHEVWWHFPLKDEPFPDTCFDTPIRNDQKYFYLVDEGDRMAVVEFLNRLRNNDNRLSEPR